MMQNPFSNMRPFALLKSCAICGSKLIDAETVPAVLYTLEGSKDVEHVRKRCCNKTCRVRFCYNYAQCGQSKLNALMPEDAEYIFINTQTGFYASARLLWNAMTEFSAMCSRETQQSLARKIQSIDIGDPLNESLMVNYQAWGGT